MARLFIFCFSLWIVCPRAVLSVDYPIVHRVSGRPPTISTQADYFVITFSQCVSQKNVLLLDGFPSTTNYSIDSIISYLERMNDYDYQENNILRRCGTNREKKTFVD